MIRGEADGLDLGEDIRNMLTASVPGAEISDASLGIPFTRVVCKQAIVLREDIKAKDQSVASG